MELWERSCWTVDPVDREGMQGKGTGSEIFGTGNCVVGIIWYLHRAGGYCFQPLIFVDTDATIGISISRIFGTCIRVI